MFTRILVAVDGSRHADRALAEGIDLAQRTGGRLTIISCAPDPSAWEVSGGAYAGVDLTALRRELDAEHEKLLDQARASVPDDLPVITRLLRGHAAERILEEFAGGDHDLLIMGSRGRGGLKSVLLGSVSHQVVSAAPSAVLVVHDDAERSA